MEVTKNIGVTAVYDSLGKAVYKKSLEVLMPLGIFVNYGQSSGPLDSIDLNDLRRKSLFFTCPSLFHYKANRMELILSATEVFAKLLDGTLKVNIAAEFPLSQAADAHKLIESGNTTGSVILIP